MDTTVRATCPQCRSPLRIPAQFLGQMVRCKKCGAVVRTKAKAAPAVPAAAAPAPVPGYGAQPVPVPVPVPQPAAAPVPIPDLLDFELGGPPQPAAPAPAAYPYPAPAAQPYPAPYPADPYSADPYPAPAAYPQAEYPYPQPAYPYPQAVPQPVAGFQASERTSNYRGRGRYGKTSTGTKITWAVVCLGLTAGLVVGAVYGIPAIKNAINQDKPTADDGKAKNGPGDAVPGGAGQNPAAAGQSGGNAGPFPRRMLFVSITKYMYLNPLTTAQPLAPDRTRPTANLLAHAWRVPHDPTGKPTPTNQVFLLSDTERPDRIPLKPVVTGTYEGFFTTCRPEDRIVVYYGGHAVDKDGVAYLIPAEGDPDEPDTLIPLADFYAKLQACPATQKVVIWDVCRYNYEQGRVLPGSEKMTPELEKALLAAPAGTQVVLTCQAGENALEFNGLVADDQRPSGTCFLEAAKYVVVKDKALTSGGVNDPIPVDAWVPAIAKRVSQIARSATEKAGEPLTQTVKLAGALPATLVAHNPASPPAAQFGIPQSPPGASAAEIAALYEEFKLPPINPEAKATDTVALVPYPADVLAEYKADKVTLADIKNPDNREEYKFRLAVVRAFETTRDLWGTGASDGIRTKFEGKVSDAVKKEIAAEQVKFPARATPKLQKALFDLNAVAELKDKQPKRWQAHYEFALGEVKARLAWVDEYNLLLGNIVTESLPALDEAKGLDAYALVATEKMKSKKDVQELAKEAKEHFEKVMEDYKGTPWALQARREKGMSLGLVWKPISTKLNKE